MMLLAVSMKKQHATQSQEPKKKTNFLKRGLTLKIYLCELQMKVLMKHSRNVSKAKYFVLMEHTDEDVKHKLTTYRFLHDASLNNLAEKDLIIKRW